MLFTGICHRDILKYVKNSYTKEFSYSIFGNIKNGKGDNLSVKSLYL